MVNGKTNKLATGLVERGGKIMIVWYDEITL